MAKLYIPKSTGKLWAELVRYDRKLRQLRPTALAFAVFLQGGVPYVPVVATKRTLERMATTGVRSYAPPKGGIDSKDKRRVERAAAREHGEETGIPVPEAAFVRLLCGPYYFEEPDIVDRFRLRRKGYGKKGTVRGFCYPVIPGKVLYSALYVLKVDQLPRAELQPGEICDIAWVSSFREYAAWTEGSKLREFLISTAVHANVWPDTPVSCGV